MREGFLSPAHEDRTLFMAIYPIARRIAAVRSAGSLAKFSTVIVDRQDLEQEILAAIWKALHRYDPRRASVRTYLERVSGTRIASLARTERRHHRFESIQIDQLLAPDSTPALELRIDVRCVFAFLPKADRDLAKLLMEYSPIETSRILGVSRSGVYRGIQRIRRTFQGAGFSSREGSRQMPYRADAAARVEGESRPAMEARLSPMSKKLVPETSLRGVARPR